MKGWQILGAVSAVLCMLAPAPAAALEDSIPSFLDPWKPWVLYHEEHRSCPTFYNNAKAHQCIWPSRLELKLDSGGGEFVQHWHVLAESQVPLPGGPGQWPLGVTVNGEEVPVAGRGGVPFVPLSRGKHAVAGNFSWKRMPEALRIPPESGLVNLVVDGRRIDFPALDSGGSLWLQKRPAEAGEADRMEVQIFRLLDDTIPMRVTNHLKINVSGRPREEKLGSVLLEGAAPVGLDSPLPLMVESDGDVLIQVRPGQWQVKIETRLKGPVHAIGPVQGGHGNEVWSFKPRNHLRMARVEGVPSVDPLRTEAPQAWKSFSTYLVKPGAKMVFEEIRRGDPDPAPDQLNLRRTWWLDFDGSGFTIRDEITGTMSRNRRLNMQPSTELGRVLVDGEPRLITDRGASESLRPGVELRKGRLQLVADSRFEASRQDLPAVSWDHDFQSLSAVLNLPPGWRLLTARGADAVPGTWLQQWTLLDLFLVLITAMAVWKLYNPGWSLLALLTLALAYQEPGAPRQVWLHLLAAWALLLYLPQGKLRGLARWWWWGAVVVLLVVSIPFIVQQVRLGIHPQLESRSLFYGHAPRRAMDLSPQQTAPSGGLLEKSRKKGESYYSDERAVQQAPAARKEAVLSRDPNALVQTGPGLPSWQWKSVSMRWNGPVDRGQRLRLWLIPPSLNLALAFLRVGLLALLITALLRPARRSGPSSTESGRASRSAAAGLAILFLLCPLDPAAAQSLGPPETQASGDTQKTDPSLPSRKQAQESACPRAYPPSELLRQLKERLLEKPSCLPHCADIPRMELSVENDRVVFLLEVHALADTAVPLPGSTASWRPREVLVNGEEAEGLLRDEEGALWLMAPRGVHRITLTGQAPPGNGFQIPLPLKPRSARVRSKGWKVEGVRPDGQVEGSLQLTPLKKTEDRRNRFQTSQPPPFLHVRRVLSLGLTWRVETTVRRVTPAGTPIVVAVPLLEGESLTTAGIRAEDGRALINMDPKTTRMSWSSTLETKSPLVLEAPQGVPWTESWVLDASPIWHCELSGIPVVHHQDQTGYWKPQWRPWPGETVKIEISRPEAIPGRLVTIEGIDLVWTPGERLSKGELALTVRTSQGGRHPVELPESAQLQRVFMNGQIQPIRLENGRIVLPLEPGEQSAKISWHQPGASPLRTEAPRVHAGSEAVNADVTFMMPRNRWILWTHGPQLGPAVLFWTYLVVVILAAAALGRSSGAPLRTHEWLLLGLGLTQVHPLVAIAVAGWLVALGVRGRRPPPEHWLPYNATQFVLAAWTLLALAGLYTAVQQGLLGLPDMQIAGNGSHAARLHWTQDRISGVLPRPWVVSLPLYVYRILMLAWALWLALALLRWLKWGWRCFGEGGLWKKAEIHLKRPWKRSPEEARNSNIEARNKHQ